MIAMSFDRDSLSSRIYSVLEKEWPDAHKSKIEGATQRIRDVIGAAPYSAGHKP